MQCKVHLLIGFKKLRQKTSQRINHSIIAKKESRAKVAGSCLLAAVYLSFILLYNLPMHTRREVDMAVFEAPL